MLGDRASPGVGLDELIDEFLDDRMGGVFGGEFGKILRGFECDHGFSPDCGHKKTR
jgi:hypothetical protein